MFGHFSTLSTKSVHLLAKLMVIYRKFFKVVQAPSPMMIMMMMMMMMMMINCFCGMVDQRKAFSLISSQNHCQRSSPSRISDTPWAGFEPAQSLRSGLVQWSCAVVITTTPRRHISSCTSYFWVKILLVKLKNLHTSVCLKLHYCTTQRKPKM